MAPDDPTLGGLAHQSLLAAWFNADSPLAPLIAEPETFLPAIIRALRSEMQQFRTETWYTEVLAPLHALPRFRHYWTVEERQPALASAARALASYNSGCRPNTLCAMHASVWCIISQPTPPPCASVPCGPPALSLAQPAKALSLEILRVHLRPISLCLSCRPCSTMSRSPRLKVK
jgi:hypothetical protein